MAYNPRDYYFKKAKEEHFAARSVFKLEEIDQRFKIFRQNQQILDLGAAPGSWSQYASIKAGPKGRILAIDLQKIKITLPNALFIQADLRDLNLDETVTNSGIKPPFQVVMSDMAPKTTGIRVTDQARSIELCELALSIANRFLQPGGSFIAKLFHSDEFEGYRKTLRTQFKRVEVLRPKSTRKESKEVFFVCLDYLGTKEKPPSEAEEKK